ncbi:hypothetical protein, partial [Pseudomonas sp. GW460-LB5]|uniref:hypothetical protein n=1 Tax=Pseudomonas sp. GW460-LB5 TaxID=2751366 RepID=UPI001A914305
GPHRKKLKSGYGCFGAANSPFAKVTLTHLFALTASHFLSDATKSKKTLRSHHPAPALRSGVPSLRPPEVAKSKIKSKIESRRHGRSQKYCLLLAMQQTWGADRRIVSTGSKFAPDCSCSTRRGALDCRPL